MVEFDRAETPCPIGYSSGALGTQLMAEVNIDCGTPICLCRGSVQVGLPGWDPGVDPFDPTAKWHMIDISNGRRIGCGPDAAWLVADAS